MTLTDSRNGPGTLTLGELENAGCQMANIRLVPSHSETEGTATLCDVDPAPTLLTAWKLQGSAVQDFQKSATEGFVEFCRANNAKTVPFAWEPNTATMAGLTYTGSCLVRAVEIGGDVKVQNKADFEFPIVGPILRTEPSGTRAFLPSVGPEL